MDHTAIAVKKDLEITDLEQRAGPGFRCVGAVCAVELRVDDPLLRDRFGCAGTSTESVFEPRTSRKRAAASASMLRLARRLLHSIRKPFQNRGRLGLIRYRQQIGLNTPQRSSGRRKRRVWLKASMPSRGRPFPVMRCRRL
jgi:hypothetical protein